MTPAARAFISSCRHPRVNVWNSTKGCDSIRRSTQESLTLSHLMRQSNRREGRRLTRYSTPSSLSRGHHETSSLERDVQRSARCLRASSVMAGESRRLSWVMLGAAAARRLTNRSSTRFKIDTLRTFNPLLAETTEMTASASEVGSGDGGGGGCGAEGGGNSSEDMRAKLRRWRVES